MAVLKAGMNREEVARASETDTAPTFAPWSIPAALCLCLGILLAQQGLSWFLMIVASGGLGLAFFLSGQRFRWLLPLLLFLPLGYGRYTLWNAADNPVTSLVGETLEVSGTSDGRILTLDEPAGARVVLSPQGEVGRGRVTLTGTFLEPAGKRNPGGFDYQGYLRRRGIWGQLLVKEVTEFKPAGLSVKARVQRGVVAGLSDTNGALMQAMTLGIRDDLGELREAFSSSGLAHILALSGLHVGILVTFLGFALRPLGLLRYPFLIVLVVGYVLLVGATPSVVRAAAMTCAALLTLWQGAGRIAAWPSLALAALLALFLNPSWLFDLSFQLSYLAVMGLLIFTTPLMTLVLGEDHNTLPWYHWKQLTVGSIMVSVAGQLLTLPLIASSFGSLPILSPLTNVFAIPLALLLVPLGFVAGVAGLVSLPLAALVNAVTGVCASALVWVAEVGSTLPNLIWGEVGWLGYSLFYLGMFALALTVWHKLRPWRSLVVVTVALVCSVGSSMGEEVAEVIFLDVGQGDSALIKLPGRLEILIDGGGTPFSNFDTGKRTVLPALKALGVDELELVIASHADTDHLEGLISLLDEMPAKQLVVGTPKPDDPLYAALIDAAERNDVPVLQVTRGESLTLGEARLDILNPPRKPFEKDNDNSVVFVLNINGQPKALFLGDASIDVERELAFPDVDILMAGHHGSKTSTSDALLRAAKPEHVVFSYGRNTYGHPNSDLVNRVLATGAKVYKTHERGAIRLRLE